MLPDVLARTRLAHELRRTLERRRQRLALARWDAGERFVPPPHVVKQRALLNHAQRFGLRTLVETGTYYGDMVNAMLGSFDAIYSIELSDVLFAYCSRRFRDQPHVHLRHGDSGKELASLVSEIQGPALFWLDGHYSAGVTARGDKDSPALDELSTLLARPEGDVFLIDDARCFGKDPGYPTLAAVTSVVRSQRPAAVIDVVDDAIRITPR